MSLKEKSIWLLRAQIAATPAYLSSGERAPSGWMLSSFENASLLFAGAIDDQNGNAIHNRIDVTASGASKRYNGLRLWGSLDIRLTCRAHDQAQ